MLSPLPINQYKNQQYCLKVHSKFPQRKILNKPKAQVGHDHLA